MKNTKKNNKKYNKKKNKKNTKKYNQFGGLSQQELILLLIKATRQNNVELPPEILESILKDLKKRETPETLDKHLLSDWRQHDQRLDPFAWENRLTAP